MSSKTLAGLPNKWPERYPRREDVASLFPDHPAALNLIHYNTDVAEALADEVDQVAEHGGPHLHGLQLNVRWPRQDQVAAIRERHPAFRIVLQIGSKAMEQAGGRQEIAGRVADYKGLVDDILIDPSGGLGKPFDPIAAEQALHIIHGRCHTIGMGIAGGLCAAALPLVEIVLASFPILNIDAEGRLRDVRDHLDLDATAKYVLRSYNVMSHYIHS